MTARVRVDQFRELREDFHDLVGTFAAGGHDDNVGFALLGDGVLENGLSAAERTRDEAGAAFRDRIEGVDDTHARLHDLLRTRFLAIGLDGHLDRPFLGHGHRDVFPVCVQEDGDDMVDVVLPGGFDGFDGIFSLEGERNHDLMGQPAFLDFAEPVGGDDLVARLGDRGEVP